MISVPAGIVLEALLAGIGGVAAALTLGEMSRASQAEAALAMG